MENSLRRRVYELGLYDKVWMAGFIPDPDRDKLYKIADVSVFPSLYEPFGIVALEAMAAGSPVVVTDVGGLREVVKHNETGIIVYPDNIESLSWGILHTLRRPDWSATRAANAYRGVCSEYSWDHIAERTIQVYDRTGRGEAAGEVGIIGPDGNSHRYNTTRRSHKPPLSESSGLELGASSELDDCTGACLLSFLRFSGFPRIAFNTDSRAT